MAGPSITPVHAESGRYGTSLVFLTGLWVDPGVWSGFASYLGHRGWESELVDLREVPGGIVQRGEVIADRFRGLPRPPVLIAHGSGALVAVAAARTAPVAAVVLMAPLTPRHHAAREALRRWTSVRAVLSGRPLPPPPADAPILALGGLPQDLRRAIAANLAPDSATAVLDVARGRVVVGPLEAPTLVLCGEGDPLAPPSMVAAFTRALGAEQRVLPGGTHWLPCAPGWQAHVSVVHRWLVQCLGESLLEFYAEAMAERGDDEPQ
jgi:pimeloyl-ACP methyl ester carboxylesterase